MTNKDASFLLGACRPNGADATDPEFAEALLQAERDPALKEWFAAERRTDATIAASLQSVPVPADLRSRILTGGRVSRPRPWFSTRHLWAIAAMIVAFAGIGSWYENGSRRMSDQWQDDALAALTQLVSGKSSFDAQSPKVADLEQWLRSNGSPVTGDIPGRLQQMASLGCKTIYRDGHPVSIICFHGPGGELVHLAMTSKAALANPPPEGQPVYAERDGWNTASWSQDGMAMMLVTKAPESQLRSLLALVVF
jgi:anti-sigma factor RsiW